MKLNRCAYTILGILRARNSTDKVHGLTVNEISEREKVSKPNTIHKKIKELQTEGYVQEGVKAGKAKTYYMTEKGTSILPIKKEDNENV